MWLNMGCPRDQRSLRALPWLGCIRCFGTRRYQGNPGPVCPVPRKDVLDVSLSRYDYDDDEKRRPWCLLGFL